MKASPIQDRDTKWVFLKKGTCSRTLFYILNREFDHPMEDEERAIDPLAGGILQNGYQCGQVWGASMAVGAETFRRCNGDGKAGGLAISATRHLLESFVIRTSSADCFDITQADFKNKKSMAKYMISGKAYSCFRLADKWAPEAIIAAREALSSDDASIPHHITSCASEVVRKMGGSEMEAVMVAGFAGGLGLSGNCCGALAAAIWMNTLKWCRENKGASAYSSPAANRTLEVFFASTDYEFLCENICRQRFGSIEEHSQFVSDGGCGKLINDLAGS